MSTATTCLTPCPEMLDHLSPSGLTVYRLTPDEEWSQLIYPDRHSFLEDGQSLRLHTASGDRRCRLDQDGTLEPLPGLPKEYLWCDLAADGRHMIYGLATDGEEGLEIYRLDLRSGDSEKVFAASGRIQGGHCVWQKLGDVAASWDGSRIAGLAYMDYGQKPNGEVAIIVIDAATGTSQVIWKAQGNHSHLRYYPGPEEPYTHDLIVQHSHGGVTSEFGRVVPVIGPRIDAGGVDLHVMRDDGSNLRELPFGRDGIEINIGHQVFRWPSFEVASVILQGNDNSYGWADGTGQHVVTGLPVPADPDAPHSGGRNRQQHRFRLCEPEHSPRLCHLSVDRTGLKFAFDTFPVYNGKRSGMTIYLGLTDDLHSPIRFQYILNSGVNFTGNRTLHSHPILSPDGQRLFFNSDFLGPRQAYMVEGLPWNDM